MADNLIPTDYADWLEAVKSRIQSARSRAALAVNAELIQLYHSIGSDILDRQTRLGWGSKVIARAAADLKSAFPDMKGFSTRNLHYMRLFAEQCPSTPIVQQAAAELEQEILVPRFGQQPAAQLPWFHIVTLLTQAELAEREWYAVHAIAGGWSRHTLQTNLPSIEEIEAELAGETMDELDAEGTPIMISPFTFPPSLFFSESAKLLRTLFHSSQFPLHTSTWGLGYGV